MAEIFLFNIRHLPKNEESNVQIKHKNNLRCPKKLSVPKLYYFSWYVSYTEILALLKGNKENIL